jgi:DNA mismatch repair protein MutS
MKKIDELVALIDESIAEAPPLTIMEGHVIKKGYNKEVDEIRSLTGDSKSWIKEFEEKEKVRTGITSLKVSFNNVFGYYIDVTKTHQSKVPADYIRKQTLVNSERYITEELKEKESIILGAEQKLFALEYKLFQDIRDKCLPYLELLQKVGKEVAVLDILSGFAHLAKTRNYVEPTIYDFGQKDGLIEIKNGRHPIVETISQEEFVSNDTSMNLKDSRMCVLTGPNMSGKSTYIRQVAVIVLMAQIGCFVPADKCELSLVDRIFTRVGASDDLSRGRSTFMVEMDEAANIVNNATKYSLVILDEIGRGTSTYDGVSIAWALAEHLTKEIKSRTLFATHYHELLKLSEKIPEGVRNFNVLVDEDQEKGVVIFLRKIVEGGTDRSYGIYVAKMAGLPDKVIARANEILEGFEQESMFAKENEIREGVVNKVSEVKNRGDQYIAQIPLFEVGEGEILKELKKIDLDTLTPLDALNIIAKWIKKTYS